MALLSINLLGSFKVTLANEPVTNFATDKVRALLAYLALSPDHPYRRETLAGLLWPEFPERSARTNLRNALANLRQVICDGAASPPFLRSTRQTIQFNGQSNYWLDAQAFEDLLVIQPVMGVQLEQALSLVRGPFLNGFSLADAAPFEEWLLLRREHYGRLVVEALDKLVASHERHGAYELALSSARQRAELAPWQEEGQRQLMRLLVYTGRRAAALTSYEMHRQALARELGVEPAPETKRLYTRIREGNLDRPAMTPVEEYAEAVRSSYPDFLQQESDAIAPPSFVARELELERLNDHLDDALAGQGHIIFVTGGPGRGKTALLDEFGLRAMEQEPDLLVASGRCNAYSGIGDPYLPFREIMSMLTGDVEARWSAGRSSTIQARRLWKALPLVVQALLQHGPLMAGSLIAEETLLSRAALWCAINPSESRSAAWLHRLRKRVEHRRAEPVGTEQSHLFQQVTNLLLCLAKTHPLLLILDDLQWLDAASASLLFHLGRRLQGSRMLIAGAYRPEEVMLDRIAASDRPGNAVSPGPADQHPLAKMLGEFKRNRGDIWLDLTERDASQPRHFVDSFLETEPNHLSDTFRRKLAQRAGGHPLFTIELVRAMKARGDLVQDSKGFWIEGAVLDWDTLPVRVQGTIEVRIGRLEPELRAILSTACVEGEDITVPVLAQVLGMNEEVLLKRLAQDLTRLHKLLAEQAAIQVGPRLLSRFKFSHALVQNYLYQQLSQAERRLLHGKVGNALEDCYGDKAEEFVVQLAHHFSSAGDDRSALHYLTQAAQHAHSAYAYGEAHAYYTRAIEAAKRVSADTETVINLYLSRGLAFQKLDDFAKALADYEEVLRLIDSRNGDASQRKAWRALINMGRLWSSRDYNRAYDYFQAALELAELTGDPKLLAESLNCKGNWYLNQANPRAAIEHHARACKIFQRAGDRPGLARTLDLLGIANLLGGNISASVINYDQAISLFREIEDQSNLASSLTGRGHAGYSAYHLLTILPGTTPVDPQQDFAEAARISRRIGSQAGEAWVYWSWGILEIVQGRYGQAVEVIQRSREIATQIGHREWIVGSLCILAELYLALLAPEDVSRQLHPALTLARELQSWVWIRQATGALAAAYCLLDDTVEAQRLLDQVLSAETPMDATSKRYCWARRAELALCQGNPVLTLDIVKRLIASAHGMAPGRVISFLWKLKGEAMAALGDTEAAVCLLQAALNNARLTGERSLLWRIHASLGWVYNDMGLHPEAESEFANARGLIYDLARTVPDVELRNNFIRTATERLNVLPHAQDDRAVFRKTARRDWS